jgi:hypothetical protein
LGPDSPVWTKTLLENAAAEIAGREDPMEQPEGSGAMAAAENARLRCELARLRADYGRLDRKYAALLAQFQALAGRRGGRR